jgi:hypothetical protein
MKLWYIIALGVKCNQNSWLSWGDKDITSFEWKSKISSVLLMILILSNIAKKKLQAFRFSQKGLFKKAIGSLKSIYHRSDILSYYYISHILKEIVMQHSFMLYIFIDRIYANTQTLYFL